MMFRFVCVCLLLSEVSGQRGSGVPYSFGFYNFDNRPSGSGSVPSVNDLGEVKGGPPPSSSYTSSRYPILSYPAQSSPMQMPPNQASYAWMPSTLVSQQGPSQTQAKPVWGLNPPAQEAQVPQTSSQPAKTPPAPVRQVPQTTSQQAKTPPAPVRQVPQTTSQQAKTPPAPVRQEPAHDPKHTPSPTGDYVAEKRYFVPYSFGLYNFDNRPSGSGSVPSVNDLGEVKGGPPPSSSYTSSRYPILSYPAQSSPMQMPPNQASYAWMPSTLVSQQGPSQTQAKPVWGLNPPAQEAQVPQTSSQPAKTPPAPVRQVPQTTSQQAKTPPAPVRQVPQTTSQQAKTPPAPVRQVPQTTSQQAKTPPAPVRQEPQTTSQQAKTPPAPVRQVPQTTSQQAKTPPAPVRQVPQTTSQQAKTPPAPVRQEPAHDPKHTPSPTGDYVAEKHYFVPYSFGLYNFDNRPSGSGSVPSVNDLGEVKGGPPPSSSYTSSRYPILSYPAQSSPMQMPPNQASYAWMPSTLVSQQGPSQTQAKPVWGLNRPAQEAQAPQTTSQQAKTPPAPVRQVPQTTSQQAKTPPAPVRQEPQTTSQQAKTPPAPVRQVPQTTSQQAKTPPAPVRQEPQTTSQQAKTPPAPVRQAPQTTSQQAKTPPVRQEPAHDPKPTPSRTGDSVEEKRYLVIAQPSGFQTRYVVKSFNRYVRGKKVFSQTTYIPLHYRSSETAPEPAPVTIFP
ncbi:extensin-like isoform X3 [Alosa sapidissima]|uniref:extensin-like isoform X3 n=1 Tax=Alosa sapidissima TaxID=34773 RepID=UPI001C08CDD4|nr:extensin-like isoform X3 [Alosa sapidissima]